MQTIKIQVNDTIYDNVIFLLKSLKSSGLEILDSSKREKAEAPKALGLKGVFHKYADPKRAELEKSAWSNHLISKHKGLEH